MLTKDEFNLQIARGALEVGESYEELMRLGNLLSKVCGFPQVYLKTTVPVTRNSTNTTGTGGVDDNEEVEMGRVVIPAGTLQNRVSMWIHTLWRGFNSASIKNFNVRINGTSVSNLTATTSLAQQQSMIFHSNNALNSQKAVNASAAGWEASGAGFIAGTHDNNSDIVITFTCHWSAAVASETITLEESMVIIVPG